MLFCLGTNKADIDIDATKELYKRRLRVNQNCYCPSCRNYGERMRRISPAASAFFSAMGVDPNKAEDVWAYLPGEKPFTQRYWCILPLVSTSAEIGADDSFETVEEGLLAGFACIEGKTVLVLDWALRWVAP